LLILSILVSLPALNGSPILGALEVRLAGQALPIPPDSELRGLLYRLSIDDRTEQAISLAELIPPLADAWRVEAWQTGNGRTDSATKSVLWSAGDLAERLDRFWLIEKPGGTWGVVFDGKTLDGVGRIDVTGEHTEERPPEIWVSWEGVKELKKEIDRWSRLTGVKAKTVDVPDVRTKLLSVQRGGGRMPDLVMIQSDDLPALTAAATLQALDGMDSSSLVDKGRNAFNLKGRNWALPFYFDAQLVFYNPKLLSTPPAKNWDLARLEAESRRIVRTGRTPLAWNAYSAYWILPFALGFGKQAIEDADGMVRPDDMGTRSALAWLLRMRDEGLMAVLERDAMIGRFASGETAMILTGSYSIPEFERIGIPFGIAAYPTVPETGKPVAPFLDFKGLAITRSSRSPLTVRRLASYLTGPGVQQRFTSSVSKLPANHEAWELVRTTNAYFPQLERSYEIGVTVPATEAYSTYKNIMWKILRFVFAGSMTIDEALGEARRLIEANLKQ